MNLLFDEDEIDLQNTSKFIVKGTRKKGAKKASSNHYHIKLLDKNNKDGAIVNELDENEDNQENG